MYDHDVLVYFGDVLDVAGSLSEYLSKDEIIEFVSCMKGTFSGRTLQIPGKGTLIYMPEEPCDAKSFATLSHEIFHAAYLILQKIGVTCTDDSDEAYAYLIGYLTERILTSISSSTHN